MNTTTVLSTLESEKNQKIVDFFCVNGVIFVNLHSLHELAYINTNAFTFNYGLTLNFYKTDVKHLYYHMFIHELCNFITSKPQKVVFCNGSIDNITDKQYQKVKTYITTKVKTLLPIIIYNSEHSFTYIKENFSNKWSIMCEVDNNIIQINNIDKTKFTFAKLKKFLDKQNLRFLKDSYFNLPQIKLPLLT